MPFLIVAKLSLEFVLYEENYFCIEENRHTRVLWAMVHEQVERWIRGSYKSLWREKIYRLTKTWRCELFRILVEKFHAVP
jgi:hypothetical protein